MRSTIDVNEIRAICASYKPTYVKSYSPQKYYIGAAITSKKLKNARTHFPLPTQDAVIAIIATNVFGSCKNGLAITANGVYWKNRFSIQSDRTYLNWQEFSQVNIKHISGYNIEIGTGNLFEALVSSLTMEHIVQLLQQLQTYVRGDNSQPLGSQGAPPPPPPPEASEWMVAMNGVQYGPYSVTLLKKMVEANQIQPALAYVWKQGMDDWVPFYQQRELVALVMNH